MKSTLDANGLIYKILNVSAVTSVIGGTVYNGKRPQSSRSEDVSIVDLPINGTDTVQKGTSVINIYVPNLSSDNRKDLATLKTNTDAVLSTLEDYEQSNTYFNFDIVSQNVMDDYDDNTMSYSSIRLNYFIENV